MNEFDDLMSGPQPVDLTTLVGSQLPAITLPKSAVVNRAATVALASDPQNAVQNFQLMVAENDQGSEDLVTSMQQRVVEQSQAGDKQAYMSIMSDPKVPIERKRQLIEEMAKAPSYRTDTSMHNLTRAAAAPSKGETRSAEDARINAVTTSLAELHESRTLMQGLVNQHAAGMRDVGVGTVGEMAAFWVMPFGINVSQAREVYGDTGSLGKALKAFALPGSSFLQRKQALENLPPTERVEAVRNFLSNLEKSSGVILSDNDFQEVQKAKAALEKGGYDTFDSWIDNLSGLLDIVGLGVALRGLKKPVKLTKPAGAPSSMDEAGKRATEAVKGQQKDVVDVEFLGASGGGWVDTISDGTKRIQYNAAKGLPNPLSPHETAKAANPSSARASHKAVVEGEEAVTEAMTGTNKVDAVANDVYPQHGTESGRVFAQPTDIQREVRQATFTDKIWEFMSNMGRLEYTTAEKAAIRGHVVNDFKSATGMVMHENMSTFTVKGGNIEIGAMYGTPEGAWSSAQSAIDQTKYALRKYGVLDDDIELLKKQGTDYVPTTLQAEAGQQGSYMVRINTTHEIDPTDVTKFEEVTTKRNWMDRIPGSEWFQGNLSAYITDAASRIDPKISKGASAANDYTARFEKLMLEEVSIYSDLFNKLPKENQARVNAYLFEANKNEIKFDRNDLISRGWFQEEIDAAQAWRNFWDQHYHLENYDLVRSLIAEGYMLFTKGDTDFYVKRTEKNINVGPVYDANTDLAADLSKAFLDDLYDNGGYVAKIKTSMVLDGKTVQHVIVRNTPDEYARKFRDSDRVLNYREGYYTLQYDAPRFIDEYRMVGGQEIKRTIAVAGDSDEARRFITRKTEDAEEGVRYEQRADVNAYRRTSDEWFDIEGARGRIAQRRRGKLLEDASGTNYLGDGEYIINPVDSAIKAARSISGRTVNRPMLEAAKARLKQQFAVEFGSDGMGGVRWPTDAAQIGKEGNMASKAVADAKTNWAYINYLENGYINHADEFFKRGMFAASEALGEVKGAGKLQRGLLKASEMAPTTSAKQAVYMASIVANPLRQWIVQPHQAVRVFAYNPKGFMSGAIAKNFGEYASWLIRNAPEAEAVPGSFIHFLRDSGVMDGVDKQNLVRGTLLDAAEATHPVTKGVKEAGAWVRRIGFDAGEQLNMGLHMSAAYDRYKRAGKNLLDPDVRAEAMQEARAVSYEMNFAGDFPYNQNSVAFIMQFAQVGHKAFLQGFNRKLDRATRARLVAFDLAMWGPPVGVAYYVSEMFGGDVLPEDKVTREALLYGLEYTIINESLRHLLKDESVSVDVTSLAPMDMTGFRDVATAFLEQGALKAFAESPAGQLFFKDQSRMQVALGSIARYFGVSDPINETPEEFTEMLLNVGKIAGGINNAHKAFIILDAQQRYDAMGRPQGDAKHTLEAVTQLFGFGDMSSKQLFEMSKAMTKKGKDHKEEVLSVYKTVLTHYQIKMEEGIQSPRQMQAVSQALLKRYANDPVALQIITNQLKQDLKDPEMRLMESFLKSVNVPGMDETRDKIKNAPMPDETKEKMIMLLDEAAKVHSKKEE
jgi:hypothetical protein